MTLRLARLARTVQRPRHVPVPSPFLHLDFLLPWAVDPPTSFQAGPSKRRSSSAVATRQAEELVQPYLPDPPSSSPSPSSSSSSTSTSFPLATTSRLITPSRDPTARPLPREAQSSAQAGPYHGSSPSHSAPSPSPSLPSPSADQLWLRSLLADPRARPPRPRSRKPEKLARAVPTEVVEGLGFGKSNRITVAVPQERQGALYPSVVGETGPVGEVDDGRVAAGEQYLGDKGHLSEDRLDAALSDTAIPSSTTPSPIILPDPISRQEATVSTNPLQRLASPDLPSSPKKKPPAPPALASLEAHAIRTTNLKSYLSLRRLPSRMRQAPLPTAATDLDRPPAFSLSTGPQSGIAPLVIDTPDGQVPVNKWAMRMWPPLPPAPHRHSRSTSHADELRRLHSTLVHSTLGSPPPTLGDALARLDLKKREDRHKARELLHMYLSAFRFLQHSLPDTTPASLLRTYLRALRFRYTSRRLINTQTVHLIMQAVLPVRRWEARLDASEAEATDVSPVEVATSPDDPTRRAPIPDSSLSRAQPRIDISLLTDWLLVFRDVFAVQLGTETWRHLMDYALGLADTDADVAAVLGEMAWLGWGMAHGAKEERVATMSRGAMEQGDGTRCFRLGREGWRWAKVLKRCEERGWVRRDDEVEMGRCRGGYRWVGKAGSGESGAGGAQVETSES